MSDLLTSISKTSKRSNVSTPKTMTDIEKDIFVLKLADTITLKDPFRAAKLRQALSLA
jgi:hypothetical protein